MPISLLWWVPMVVAPGVLLWTGARRARAGDHHGMRIVWWAGLAYALVVLSAVRYLVPAGDVETIMHIARCVAVGPWALYGVLRVVPVLERPSSQKCAPPTPPASHN